MLDPFLNSAAPLFTYMGAFLALSIALLNTIVDPDVDYNSWLIVCPTIFALISIFNTQAIEPFFSVATVFVVLGSLLSYRPSKKVFVFVVLMTLIIAVFMHRYYLTNLDGVKITAMLHEEEDIAGANVGEMPFYAAMLELWEEKMVDAFKDEYGVEVEIKGVASNISDRYYQIKKELEKTPRSEQVDVFAIDVIWPDLLSEYAEDLNGLIEGNLEEKFFQEVVGNNKVKLNNKDNEKLVALPWYVDVGLLFYRKDLLGDKDPPETWNDLEEMARDIQT